MRRLLFRAVIAGACFLAASPEAASPRYVLERVSQNTGGSTELAGNRYTLGVTAGQTAIGHASGLRYGADLGFWNGAEVAFCGVILTGDADQSLEIKLSDVILLVNYVLKGGAAPLPCAAAGDVTCDGEVKLSDVIYLVNYVLKAGTPPCDVCTLIPAVWSCP